MESEPLEMVVMHFMCGIPGQSMVASGAHSDSGSFHAKSDDGSDRVW